MSLTWHQQSLLVVHLTMVMNIKVTVAQILGGLAM